MGRIRCPRRKLFLVEIPDIGCRFFHHRHKGSIRLRISFLNLCIRHTDIVCGAVPFIKLTCIVKYCLVAFFTDTGNDIRHNGLILPVIVGTPL